MTAKYPDVPPELLDKIMYRIRDERQKAAFRRRFVFNSCVLSVLIVLIAPIVAAFNVEAARTGFIDFFSLIFTDFLAVIGNMGDFALSLLESFPAIYAAGILIDALAILFVLKLEFKYGRGFTRFPLIDNSFNA